MMLSSAAGSQLGPALVISGNKNKMLDKIPFYINFQIKPITTNYHSIYFEFNSKIDIHIVSLSIKFYVRTLIYLTVRQF